MAMTIHIILLAIALFSAMFWVCCVDAVSLIPLLLLVLSLIWVAVELLIIAYLQEKQNKLAETEKNRAIEQDRIRRFNSGMEAAKDYI